MVKKGSKINYIVGGQEITTYKCVMIEADNKRDAMEIYDKMFIDGELAFECHEFEVEILG